MESTFDIWRRLAERHLARAHKPLIVVLGPTASGKTGLSIEAALACGGEIINADSRQLYRHMDIGTAKITPEEMRGVPHRLLDVLDPREEATAGWYQVRALRAIDAVLARGRVPILVGGSMLYLASVTDSLSLAPDPDPELRSCLIREYDRDGGIALYRRLRAIDPETASRIHPHNKPRLVRAVEICALTGSTRSRSVPRTELRADDARCAYDLLVLGLHVSREELALRIRARTERMFAAGWVGEVRALLGQGYTGDDPGMKSCGYREIARHIRDPMGDAAGLVTEIAAKTRQYAKRQMTWWKGDQRIVWLRKL